MPCFQSIFLDAFVGRMAEAVEARGDKARAFRAVVDVELVVFGTPRGALAACTFKPSQACAMAILVLFAKQEDGIVWAGLRNHTRN